MNFVQYLGLAYTTVNPTKTQGEIIEMCLLGIPGEIGEIADLLKKEIYHNHYPDSEKLLHEVGDAYWYLAILCDKLGISVECLVTGPATIQDKQAIVRKLVINTGKLAEQVDRFLYSEYLDGFSFEEILQNISCFLAGILHVIGKTTEDALKANVEKLKKRYPEGFSEERSRNRK